MEHDLRDPLVHYRAPIPPPRDVLQEKLQRQCRQALERLEDTIAEEERRGRALRRRVIALHLLLGLAMLVAWLRWLG